MFLSPIWKLARTLGNLEIYYTELATSFIIDPVIELTHPVIGRRGDRENEKTWTVVAGL